MTYDSLDILPIKLYYKISSNGNVQLLSDTITDNKKLNDLWFDLDCGFNDLNKTEEAARTFRLSKEISALQTKHDIVLMACQSLRFDWNDDLIGLLVSYGYQFQEDRDLYVENIDRIEREVNALVVKVNMLRRQLPKVDENNKSTLDEVMASYAAILGFDFDFNTISCTKFFALQNQVHAKVKSLEKQRQTNQSTNSQK